LLQYDNVVSEGAIREGRTIQDLGIGQAATIDSIVPAYLERFKARGQYAHYRA